MKHALVGLAIASVVVLSGYAAGPAEKYLSKAPPELALIDAASAGDAAAVSAFVTRGTRLDSRDRFGRTALLAAADAGYEDIVMTLLAGGAQVDTAKPDGWTPLMAAAHKGHRGIVSALLQSGASVTSRLTNGYTTLLAAIEFGDCEMIAGLIDAGANPNDATFDGWIQMRAITNRGRRCSPPSRSKTKRSCTRSSRETPTFMRYRGTGCRR